LIGSNQLRKLLVGKAGRATPHIRAGFKLLGDGIGRSDIGVAVDLERGQIVMRHERQHEPTYRMFTEIGRDVSDAQLSALRAGHGRGLCRGGEGVGEAGIPFNVLVVELVGPMVGMKMQSVEQISGDA